MQLINGQLNLYNGLNTSGSTAFTGSVSITGSLSITGSVIANTFNGTINATNGIVSGSSQISIAGTSDYTSLFTGIASATASLNSFSASANISITNLNTYSSSVSNSIAQLNTFTSSTAALGSLNSFTASTAIRLTNLETTSASVNISVSNLNIYSASVSNSIGAINAFTSSQTTIESGQNARLSNLETTTASLNISVSNLNSYSVSVSNSIQQLNLFTSSTAALGSLNSFTSSAAIRLTNLETISASVNSSVSNLNTYSASVSNSIGNLNAFSASQTTIESGQNARLSNLETTSASVNISVSNLNTSTSSFETKGRGIISGSSQLSGTTITDLTIVNLTTINETASVIFSSGSNRFGDFGNDIHSFTGSVQISGSQTITGSLIVRVGTGETRFGGTSGRELSAFNNGTLSNFDFTAVQTFFDSDFLIKDTKKISTNNGSIGDLYLTTATASAGIRIDRNVGITGSLTITGSVIATNGFTGSLLGTASFALNGSSNAVLYQTGSAAAIWTFNHYLQTRHPVIVVYDNTDSIIIPQSISAVDTNTTTITFSSARTGTAVASKGGYVGSVITSATTATSATSASVAVTASYAISASAAATTFAIGASSTTYGSYINTIQGANTVITTPTGSFAGAFYKYVATSGSNARAGEVMAIWNNSTTQFTDVTTNDIGSTTMVTSSVALSAGSAVLSFTTNTNGWNIKTFVTYL